ncbi:MAG: polysaccharide deacetylase family protein, partial [Pedobacter sp.]
MRNKVLIVITATLLLFSCKSKQQENNNNITASGADTTIVKDNTVSKPASAQEILAKREVPVLCYHQIRNWLPSDGKRAHDDIIAPDRFESHVKMLADSGYNSILPDQLYDYLVFGKKLPEKPIMFTFDDTDLDQFTVAAPTLKKYGFKGVYFIMTVAIGKKGRIAYMSKAQIKQLSDEDNTIASHTYDHKNFADFKDEDWKTQI